MTRTWSRPRFFSRLAPRRPSHLFAAEGDADQAAVVHQPVADVTLKVELGEFAAAAAGHLRHDQQPLAGIDRPAEPDAVDAPEADEIAAENVELLRIKAG